MTRAALPSLVAALALACSGEIDDPPGADADADGDSDSDADTDADSDADADTGSGVDADVADAEDGAPPLPCEPVAGSGITISVDPPEPWDGGSARVRVRGALGLTNVALAVDGTAAAPAPAWVGVEGDGPYTWTWSLSPLLAGDYCVVFSADPDATVLQRARMHVTAEAPPVAPFKVVRNHQWTCEEEYTWAINVDTYVTDEAGAPLSGVRVLVEHAPCETADDHPPPAEVVTDADGFVRWENYNPHCFFHERVADAPSDTAIEIWTGIWEEHDGCNFCSTFAENVYGHWSYTIEFRRTPGATEVCQVQNDQAGQAACPPLPHWEEPADPVCTPVP